MNDIELLNDLQVLSKEVKHLREFKEIIENEVINFDISLLLENESIGVLDAEELIRKIETIQNLVAEYEVIPDLKINRYQMIERKYKRLGVEDYQFKTIDDIEVVLNISPLQVEGYNKLTPELQERYKKFVIDFLNGYGLEARESISPISVKDMKEYLRVDYLFRGNEEWLHITDRGTWY